MKWKYIKGIVRSNTFYRLTAYDCNNAKDVYCNVFSWVASKMIFGALPTFSASNQREIHKHHLSPDFNPGNCHSGTAVIKLLPLEKE